MRRAALLALALAVPLAASGQPNKETGVVLTAKRALLLADPQIVVGQNVQSVEVSPDGRYLVAVRFTPNPAPIKLGAPQPAPLRKDIVVWDSATGMAKEMQLSNDARGFSRMQWFPGTDRAIVSILLIAQPVVEPGQSRPSGPPSISREAFVLDASDAKLTRIESQAEGFSDLQFVVCPVAPLAVEVGQRSDERNREHAPSVSLRTLNADGSPGKSVTLPKTYEYFAGRTAWSIDGRELLVEMQRPPDSGGQSIKVVIHYDPLSGGYSETIGPASSYQPLVAESDLRLDRKATDTTEGNVTARAVSWWISSTTDTEKPAALVTEHAEYAVLPKGEKFVAFVVKGALFVRRTIELTVQDYKDMLAAAQRAALVSNAKQIALAAAMYSADYDDVLPPGLSKDDLMPYLGNEDVFKNGFVYVFGGGNLNDVKDPANTVLGYIEGNGGRAVAYIDGHVKWVPNG